MGEEKIEEATDQSLSLSLSESRRGLQDGVAMADMYTYSGRCVKGEKRYAYMPKTQ